MHMEVQIMSKVAQLGTLWRQLHGPDGDTTLQTKHHRQQKNVDNTSENGRFEDFGLGILKPYGAEVAPKWVQVGACWPKLTSSGADVAAMSDRNGAFGRCGADMQHMQITTVLRTFWQPAGSNMFVPGPFVSLAAKVPHGLGPSVRADLFMFVCNA
jgi:hypothetical protein